MSTLHNKDSMQDITKNVITTKKLQRISFMIPKFFSYKQILQTQLTKNTILPHTSSIGNHHLK